MSVLAGGVLGFLIGGVGGRLAMFLLRVTSPDSVRGIESDDGFIIGQISLDTIQLLSSAVAFGIIGAFIYRLLAPSLVGSRRVRSLVVAIAAGILFCVNVISPDGVDFTLLRPLWLAVLLFLAIPAAFGAAIVPLTERWDAPDAWVNGGGRRRWVLLGLVLVAAPFGLPIYVFAFVLTLAWAYADRVPAVHQFRQSDAGLSLARAAWCAVVTLATVALVKDIADIL